MRCWALSPLWFPRALFIEQEALCTLICICSLCHYRFIAKGWFANTHCVCVCVCVCVVCRFWERSRSSISRRWHSCVQNRPNNTKSFYIMKHICTWVVVVCRYSLSLSPCKTHDHYANCTNLHSSSSCKIGFQLLYTNMLRIQNHLQLVKWCKQSHESRDQRQKPRGGGRQRQPERFRAWEASHISTWTHKSENMEAKISDHTISIVGVQFWWPIKPLRNGYEWTSTQNAKKSFPKKGPKAW